jgi:hypothetical protein
VMRILAALREVGFVWIIKRPLKKNAVTAQRSRWRLIAYHLL